MELFGAKLNLALGVWRLRFVLMLEDGETDFTPSSAAATRPHHLTITREQSGIR